MNRRSEGDMKGSLSWLARTNEFFTRVVFNIPQDKQDPAAS